MIRSLKLSIIGLLALTLVSCAELRNAFDIVSESKVSPSAVYIAANAFNALEATATNYLRLPRCTPAIRPVCREPEITPKIINNVRAGRQARNGLVKFLKDHPNELGPRGLYDVLVASTSTLRAIFDQYSPRRIAP